MALGFVIERFGLLARYIEQLAKGSPAHEAPEFVCAQTASTRTPMVWFALAGLNRPQPSHGT